MMVMSIYKDDDRIEGVGVEVGGGVGRDDCYWTHIRDYDGTLLAVLEGDG